jgi:hypothetical protein
MDASTLQGRLKPAGSLKRLVKIRSPLRPPNLPVVSDREPRKRQHRIELISATFKSASIGSVQNRLHGASDENNDVIPYPTLVLELGESVMEPLPLGHRRRRVWNLALAQRVFDLRAGHALRGVREDLCDGRQMLRLEWRDVLHDPPAADGSARPRVPRASSENFKGSRSSRKPLIVMVAGVGFEPTTFGL